MGGAAPAVGATRPWQAPFKACFGGSLAAPGRAGSDRLAGGAPGRVQWQFAIATTATVLGPCAATLSQTCGIFQESDAWRELCGRLGLLNGWGHPKDEHHSPHIQPFDTKGPDMTSVPPQGQEFRVAGRGHEGGWHAVAGSEIGGDPCAGFIPAAPPGGDMRVRCGMAVVVAGSDIPTPPLVFGSGIDRFEQAKSGLSYLPKGSAP